MQMYSKLKFYIIQTASDSHTQRALFVWERSKLVVWANQIRCKVRVEEIEIEIFFFLFNGLLEDFEFMRGREGSEEG